MRRLDARQCACFQWNDESCRKVKRHWVMTLGRATARTPHGWRLNTFEFLPGVTLRVVEIDGDPWFVAKDVCDELGTDTKDVRANLDSDEVCTTSLPGQRGRAPLAVSESGFYALVMKSRKPSAKAFRKWVTSVVLPAIRRDGSYIKGEEKVESPEELAALQEALFYEFSAYGAV